MTGVTRARFRLPVPRAFAAFAVSTGLACGASVALGANASAEGNPSADAIVIPSARPSPDSTELNHLVVPLTASTEFLAPSRSNNACPASGGMSSPPTGGGTARPSIPPTVLGVTFDSPPPSAPEPPTKGRLPFTGVPLTQLLAMASALVGAGLLLMRSRRRHRLTRVAS